VEKYLGESLKRERRELRVSFSNKILVKPVADEKESVR
jgi:hypothetical protein